MSSTESGTQWRLDWPVSGGHRVGSAKLKVQPEDFRVTEYLWPEDANPEANETAAGAGEHLCVRLEKNGDNTEYVARELAAMAGCRHYEVGFCGLKDRHAVTVQWFSLYRPGQEGEDQALLEAIAARWPVLASRRHARKLRPGDHQGNGFELILRDVSADRSALDQALTELRERGAPNYFGPQRFGFGGGNLDRAVNLDPTRLNRKRGRGGRNASKNVLYFSAARSWLFNEVLAARVEEGNWLTVLPGEPSPQDCLPTGPLWGDGGTTATGEQGSMERDIVDAHPELAHLFKATRMKPERRALVTRPESLSWQWLEDGSALSLTFFLLPGQYATTILADIFELEDMSLGRNNKQ
ncbi:tRNA pseudouridine(13) synthase TruD [Marinobacter persicus]|uniref:tRNA pseudouridine synthase D n=1 Tax=Marinobacter persicus TaxID=930118 RepID=A0A2S6G6E4_9GAMM|nr:tRNA pseudouridine(13) synthase TruD [Marinobacter persicus]PPK51552.1 tRNA pseudouridine13 synthase [Marinobacter persicus]PPK54712.1 tRNA pseudouridine13 synthase [Marinobacter persicus]PPK58257.1 tRNA pseudouridine13 synthase [Marinobacter persicus]